MEPSRRPSSPRPGANPWLAAAAAAHGALVFFPLVYARLLAPTWFAVAAGILWLIGAVLMVVRTGHRWAAAVPIAVALLWWAGIAAGGAWLGWTA